MNAPEPGGVQPLRTSDDEPVFEEAWHAQVLALAFNLVERGRFSNAQWSAALDAELAAAQRRGEADDVETYYCAVLVALEGLLDSHSELSMSELAVRIEQWREAYLRTPHGQPVALNS